MGTGLRWMGAVCLLAGSGCMSGSGAPSGADLQIPETTEMGGDGGAPVPTPTQVVDPERELVITDLSVVEDPLRTTWSAAPGTPGRGAWTFGHLMDEMAGDQPAGQFVLDWLLEWDREQRFGDSVAPARPLMRTQIVDPWLVRSGCAAGATTCELDLTQAPFRLLAITNRLDLRDAELTGPGNSENAHTKHAGEGRFVFGALGPAGERLRFTVIFEYQQLADDAADVQDWALRWHALGSIPFGSAYNAALEDVTASFTTAGLDAGAPNGSAIAQVRTNEIGISPIWELREFVLDNSGALVLAPIQQTPDFSENGTNKLRNRIRSHASAILDGTYRVPPGQLGAIGPTPTSRTFWDAPNLAAGDQAARHQFSLNTCSGCHAGETGTRFLHIGVREQGAESVLSGFLVGADVADPVTGTVRHFADLDRRAQDLLDVATLPLDQIPPRGRGMRGDRPH